MLSNVILWEVCLGISDNPKSYLVRWWVSLTTRPAYSKLQGLICILSLRHCRQWSLLIITERLASWAWVPVHASHRTNCVSWTYPLASLSPGFLTCAESTRKDMRNSLRSPSNGWLHVSYCVVYGHSVWASQAVLVIRNPPANAGDVKRCSFSPWAWKIPWGRAWQPTPVFWPGESPGTEGSLAGYSPWGHTELDTTKTA